MHGYGFNLLSGPNIRDRPMESWSSVVQSDLAELNITNNCFTLDKQTDRQTDTNRQTQTDRQNCRMAYPVGAGSIIILIITS